MLYKSIYLYGFSLVIFGSLYCFKLSCPTKESIEQYRSNSISNENPTTNRIKYIKTEIVKDIFSQSDMYTHRYHISCPKSLVCIDQRKNTLRISEILDNAQILLQEREGTKNSCRFFQAKIAFYNYHSNTLSSPELYFSLFHSFFPIPTELQWQGVAKEATLLLKKRSSPILQTDFITFFTPENK